MSKMKFGSTRSGFLNGKGFYVALSLCLLAVGAASYIAIMSITDMPDSLELPSHPAGTSSRDTAQVGQNVSGATGSRPASSKPAVSSRAASVAASSRPNAPVATFFVMPITGDIHKPFSDTELQYSETYKDWRLHAAIDIIAAKNAPVKAAGDGTVKDVTTDPLLGVTVSIDHGNKIVSHYSGLAKSPPVKKGDIVEVGKVIGYVDSIPCEMLDPIHLHFMITENGKSISPMKLMSLME